MSDSEQKWQAVTGTLHMGVSIAVYGAMSVYIVLLLIKLAVELWRAP